jgi:hypothetical protein
VVSYFL